MSTSTTVRGRPMLVQPEAADDVAAGFRGRGGECAGGRHRRAGWPERFHLDELAHCVDAGGGARRYVVIGLLAAGLGLQNATVRRLAVPDVTTTVLTLT